MKIYLLQDHLRGGGTERQSIELTRSLNADGLHAQLIVGFSGGVLDRLAEEQLGTQLYFLSNRFSLSHLKLLSFLKNLEPNESHLLICMGRWAHSLMGSLPQRKNLRLISTVRTSRPLPYCYRRCIRKSIHLITNSHWAAQYVTESIQRSEIPERTVIHNPLSRPELLEITPKERLAARTQFGQLDKVFVLLSVARLDSGKGQADLIRALAKLASKTTQLWLLGDGSEKKSLIKLAANLGITKQVHCLGFQEKLRPYYAAADLFVCASKLDSLPNALLEAHAAGLPIVSYPSAGIPEIIADNLTGQLCQPSTPQELSRQIHKLLASEPLRQQMGSAAREKIKAQFDRQRLNQQFCSLIRSHQASR